MRAKWSVAVLVFIILCVSACGGGESGKKSDGFDPSDFELDDLEGIDLTDLDLDDFVLDGPPNYDLPHVEPHDGIFKNDHGSMTFNGDGKSVTIEFDDLIARDTGLPPGKHDAEYYFFLPLAPAGYACEYNEAHEMHFIIDGANYMVCVGEHTKDGSFTTGVNTTTADRITLFANGLESWYDFLKQ